MVHVGPIDRWRLWRVLIGGSAEDTLFSDLAPSKVLPPRAEKGSSGIITVRGLTSIHIRAFGTNADNDTFGLTVYGMMDNGPLAKIIELDCILGATAFATPEAFIDDPAVPALAWFEVDTYTEVTDIVGGSAGATPGSAPINNSYEIPTQSYKHLMLKITDKDGSTGVEATDAGVIWRPGGVLR